MSLTFQSTIVSVTGTLLLLHFVNILFQLFKNSDLLIQLRLFAVVKFELFSGIITLVYFCADCIVFGNMYRMYVFSTLMQIYHYLVRYS